MPLARSRPARRTPVRPLLARLRALAVPAVFLAVLAVAAPFGAPAAAQELRPVPEALRGAWFAGGCADPAAVMVLAARSAARVPQRGPSRLDRFVAASMLPEARGGWLVGTSRGAEAPRLMLRLREGLLESAEPDAKLPDDRLPGDAPVAAWRRCEATAPGVALAHGEGAAFLGALDAIEAACGVPAAPAGTPGGAVPAGMASGCAGALVAAGDVSGDRLLGVAEVARLLRGAAWVMSLGQEAEAGTVAAVSGVGALGALAAARAVVDSLDYDGDGRLSARELAQDRAALSPGAGSAAGRPLRLDGVGEGLELLRGLLEGLLGQN